MYDKEIILNILNNIKWSIETILKRSDKIHCYEDFLKDDTGREKLDSICMQLINIGEALKEIDKITSNELLNNYPEIDWKAVYPVKYGFSLLCFSLFMFGIKSDGLNFISQGRRYERHYYTSLF